MRLQRYHRWTQADRELLARIYPDTPMPEMVRQLGLRASQIKDRAMKLGLKKTSRGTYHVWTEEEKELLARIYADTPMLEIVAIFGLKDYQIYGMAERLGLKKSEAFLSSHPASGRLKKGSQAGKKHWYKPGNVPLNKGRKGVFHGPTETQFRPGHPRMGLAAKLYRPVGSERLSKEGYLERKINDDMPMHRRWRAVHLIVWEQVNGPVPTQHSVRFRDGNKKNITLENLELVTKQQLMAENSVHSYGPEISGLYVLRKSINRYIKKHERSKTSEQ